MINSFFLLFTFFFLLLLAHIMLSFLVLLILLSCFISCLGNTRFAILAHRSLSISACYRTGSTRPRWLNTCWPRKTETRRFVISHGFSDSRSAVQLLLPDYFGLRFLFVHLTCRDFGRQITCCATRCCVSLKLQARCSRDWAWTHWRAKQVRFIVGAPLSDRI